MTAPTITRIDVVLTQLEAIATAALADVDPEIEVLDGPRLGEQPWRHLMLGITEPPDVAPYTTQVERQDGMGRRRYVESWTVRCGLCLADGSNDLAALRSEATTVLGLLDDALRESPVVAGVWDEAGIGDAEMTWYPVPNQAGSTVLVFFSLEGAALL